MSFEIITIPCLSDNYAFLAHDAADGKTLLVDVPEAAPISEALYKRGWRLTDILLTHHHQDHVDGLAELLKSHPARVIGAKADQNRLPPLDEAVVEGDIITVGSNNGLVFDVSGHTIGHIAIHFSSSKLLFTADSLMALGCGRLFEGDPDQMWGSLSKLATLDPDTIVCSGHEVKLINKICKKMDIFTPGIRLYGDKNQDQKRVINPKQAFTNGATGIVIGRSITRGSIKNNIQKLIKSLK